MTRNVSSVLEDDPYEEIESLEAHTDEDASTVSVEDSALGDYSNADTLSDFAYDSEGQDESDDAEIEDFPIPRVSAAPTPLGLSRIENEHLTTDSLFTSTHSEATEKWQRNAPNYETPTNVSTTYTRGQSWRDKFQDFVRRLKTIPRVQHVISAFEGISNPGSVVGYVAAIVLAGLVAAAMRSAVYTVLTAGMQTSNKVASTIAGQPPTADFINVAGREPSIQHNHYPVRSWAKFETLQQTREMLSRLAGGQVESTKASTSIVPEQPKASEQPSDIRSTALAPPVIKAMDLSRKFLPAIKESSARERYFVAMRSGRLLKAEHSSRSPNADLLGPLTRIEASKGQFKTTYDKEEGKIKVARAGKPTDRAPAQIVVRSGNKVIQRGNLNSANVVHWTPSIIPESQRVGQVQVVFVLPTEALVQEQILDLGNQPKVFTPREETDIVQSMRDYRDRVNNKLSSIIQRVRDHRPEIVRNIEEYKDNMNTMVGSFMDGLHSQKLAHQVISRIACYQRRSRDVLKRVRGYREQIEKTAQLYEKYIDNKFDAFMNKHGHRLAGLFKTEAVLRTKMAQSRSKQLRYVIEQRIASFFVTDDDTKASAKQESVLGRWMEVLGLV